jgi:hypothetical protein
MTRRGLALRIAISLLAGVVLTWGVAWGLALFSHRGATEDGGGRWKPPGTDLAMSYYFECTRSAGSVYFYWTRGFILVSHEGVAIDAPPEPPMHECVPHWAVAHVERSCLAPVAQSGSPLWLEGFGWPCVAAYSIDAPGRNGQVAYGLPVPWRAVRRPNWASDGNAVLPLRPIWAGIGINVAFFGSVNFALLAAPGIIRRHRRRRGGRCVVCGYDKRGLSSCPECGT